VGDFPSTAACPPPRHFAGPAAAGIYEVQSSRPGLQPSTFAVHPADLGGGMAYEVASPRGGVEFPMNTARPAAAGLHDVLHATTAMTDFNFENLTFTPARITVTPYHPVYTTLPIVYNRL